MSEKQPENLNEEVKQEEIDEDFADAHPYEMEVKEEAKPVEEAPKPIEEDEEPLPDEPEEEEPHGHFVPEGMVLPEDDEDVDLTPRMKMPEFTGTISLAETARQVNEKLKEKEKKTAMKKAAPVTDKKPRKDDFDIELKPGDDFDI